MCCPHVVNVEGPGMATYQSAIVMYTSPNPACASPGPTLCWSCYTVSLLTEMSSVVILLLEFASICAGSRRPIWQWAFLGGLLMLPIPGSYDRDIVRWHVHVLPQRRTADLLHKLDACK